MLLAYSIVVTIAALLLVTSLTVHNLLVM